MPPRPLRCVARDGKTFERAGHKAPRTMTRTGQMWRNTMWQLLAQVLNLK